MPSDRVRDYLSFAVLAGFTLMLAGTSKAKSDPPLIPTLVDAAATANAIPPDLDLAKVAALLNCKPPNSHKACRLYTDFLTGDVYTGSPTNELWYGDSIAVGGPGDQMRDDYFMNLDASPTGVSGAGRTLIAGNAKEKKEAEDLITALRAGRTIPNSPAAAFMRTSAPSEGWKKLMKTAGKSSVLAEPTLTTFVRKNGKRLMVIEYNGTSFNHSSATSNSPSAMAWIAEMWLVPP